MSQAPQILTQPELTQRSAQPVCLIQSEEILRVKTPAYNKSKSDLSFLVRQPSASAICVNDVELRLEVKFTLSNQTTVKAFYDTGNHATDADKYQPISQGDTDYGFMPEMLPLQNKCIRNAVLTINGSSISHRMNEYGYEYCMLHGNRKLMNKIGGGINDYSKPSVLSLEQGPGKGATTTANHQDNELGNFARRFYVENETRAMQRERWLKQFTQDMATSTSARFNGTQTPTFQFVEKLYMGPFGGLQQAQSFPAWSAESAKSPGLLHVHNMQLSLAMENNWWRNLYLATVNHNAGANNMATVTDVEIVTAELMTRWCLPPPRMLSAAISQSVAYSSYDVLRFVCDSTAASNKYFHDGEGGMEFTLNAVSFPYMPSVFIFSVAPHYGHTSAVIGSAQTKGSALEAMKEDKRITITHMDLQINTSSAAVPRRDGKNTTQAHRLNARDLYRMTLENCASFEDFPYDFEQWYYNCGFVAITPGQLSGILNSPNIRGGVTLQGNIFCKNLSGHPVNTTKGPLQYDAGANANDTTVFKNGDDVPMYRCLVSRFYTNRALVLDSKSGLLTESTYSAAFQSGLRMGSSG